MQHTVDFRGTSDTGEPESAAIEPVTDGEPVNQTVLRRPPENLRTRTEVLRTRLGEHIVLSDMGEHPILTGGGLVAFNGTVGGGGDGKFTVDARLDITPWSSPINSIKAVRKIGALGVNEIVFTAVQKDMEGSDINLSQTNKISVEVVIGAIPAGTATVAVEGAAGEANNIKITVTGTTTCTTTVAAVVASGPASALVLASTADGAGTTPLWGPGEWTVYADRFLQGGAPAVLHSIPIASLNTFFNTAANVLVAGDVLAIGYDTVVIDGSTGGRLQSTPENSNTDLTAGQLFNTRVEPARIPNCIPVCRCLSDTVLKFIDGSVVTKDTPALLGAQAQAIHGGVSAAQAAAWDKINTGDHTPPTTILEALDNADAYIKRTHITTVVTDGAASTGGDYNGTTALQSALAALAGTGGTVQVRAGTYTITAEQEITKPINIVAMDASVIVDISTLASNWALKLNISVGANVEAGCLIRGLSFTGAKQAIRMMSPDIVVQQCSFNTMRAFSLESERGYVQNCKCVATEVALGFGTAAKNCVIDAGSFTTTSTSLAAVEYESEAPEGNTLRDCTITVADNGGAVQAFTDTGSSQGLCLQNVLVKCAPTAVSTDPVVMLQGETLTVRYLRIQVTSSTPIKHSVLAVTPAGKATLDDVRIDFNGSRMEYASASPITLTGDVVINDLEVHSFAIPNNTDHSVTLTDDWPIVRMSGKSDDVPIQIKGGRIHTITAGGAGAASNFCTLIGAQGHATISDNALGSENAFVLTNFTFDLDGFTPASGQNNLRCISNVPDYTKIHRCQFVRGTGDALYGVWAKDSQRVKITKNTVQFYGNARTVYFFRVTHSGTPSDYFPRHCDVSDNHIFLTKGQGILVAGKDGTDFGMYNHVNDNMFERSSVDGDPYEGIAVNESKWSSCQGNVVNNVDADNGVVAIDYVGEQTGHVPALASIATQNVVRDGTYV